MFSLFFQFFNFLFHYLIAFFLETNTKLVGTHEVSLIGALILYFCLKNVEFIASNPLHGTDTYSLSC